MNTSSVQNIERSITKITYIDADCRGVTNVKRVWEEVGGLYRFTHLIGAEPTSPGQTRNNNPKSTTTRNPKPCARDQYQERTRVKTTTSNNATAARTLASPSPCHNRQRNMSTSPATVNKPPFSAFATRVPVFGLSRQTLPSGLQKILVAFVSKTLWNEHSKTSPNRRLILKWSGWVFFSVAWRRGGTPD
jgi:hypothetical protein